MTTTLYYKELQMAVGGMLAVLGTLLGAGGMAASALNVRNNYGLQVANLDYQKDLQQKIFEREDTAIQRRMEDARAAGVNPYAVVGSGANAGSVVSTQAPQMQGINVGGMFDTVQSALGIMQNLNATKQQQATLANQQIQNANAIKEGMYLDSKLAEINLTNKMLNQDYDLKWMDINNAWLDLNRNLADFNIDFGTRWSSPFTMQNGHKIFEMDAPINSWQSWYPGLDYAQSYYLQDRLYGYESNKFHNNILFNESQASQDKRFQAQYEKEMSMYNRDLTKKELDWYDTSESGNLVDKILGYVFKGLEIYGRFKR